MITSLAYDQVLVADASVALMVVALLGLLVTGRLGLCWAFGAYLTACVICNRLIVWWPEQFWTPGFWGFKEALYAALRALVAVEIAGRTFRPFPRAWRRAVAALVLIAGLTAAGVWWAPGHQQGHAYAAMLGLVSPRNGAGSLWLFIVTAALAYWHSIPLDATRKAITLGFCLYLGFSGPLLSLVATYDRAAYPLLSTLDPIAFGASAGLWAFSVWRPALATVPEPARATTS